MAHYAELDENNVVTQVIVVSNDDCSDVNGNEVEEIGVAFCKKLLGADTNWKQTSYNNNMRVRYAGIGYSYNEELDAFIPPKPFESWVLNNETADWESPVGPAPTLTEAEVEARSFYRWDEENGEWDLVTLEPPAEETPSGYDPNATDGDGDGLVQDGTEFERPLGT
jgi:hypothetical protein